jgi:hypothetical protein
MPKKKFVRHWLDGKCTFRLPQASCKARPTRKHRDGFPWQPCSRSCSSKCIFSWPWPLSHFSQRTLPMHPTHPSPIKSWPKRAANKGISSWAARALHMLCALQHVMRGSTTWDTAKRHLVQTHEKVQLMASDIDSVGRWTPITVDTVDKQVGNSVTHGQWQNSRCSGG